MRLQAIFHMYVTDIDNRNRNGQIYDQYSNGHLKESHIHKFGYSENNLKIYVTEHI